jgi:hypothetical protein
MVAVLKFPLQSRRKSRAYPWIFSTLKSRVYILDPPSHISCYSAVSGIRLRFFTTNIGEKSSQCVVGQQPADPIKSTASPPQSVYVHRIVIDTTLFFGAGEDSCRNVWNLHRSHHHTVDFNRRSKGYLLYRKVQRSFQTASSSMFVVYFLSSSLGVTHFIPY